MFTGTRVMEVIVDGRTRVRRTMETGEVVPDIVDVRGHRSVTVKATAQGWTPHPIAADVVLGTPTVTSQVHAERSVEPGEVLSDIRPSAVDAGSVVLATVGQRSWDGLGQRFRHGLLGGSFVARPTAGTELGLIASVDFRLGGRFTRLTSQPAYWGTRCRSRRCRRASSCTATGGCSRPCPWSKPTCRRDVRWT